MAYLSSLPLEQQQRVAFTIGAFSFLLTILLSRFLAFLPGVDFLTGMFTGLAIVMYFWALFVYRKIRNARNAASEPTSSQ